MPDLMSTETRTLFTVRVRDFKADQDADTISLHGLFTDYAEAEAFARTVGVEAYPDFIDAKVVPVQGASLFQVSQAQQIGWVPPVPTV